MEQMSFRGSKNGIAAILRMRILAVKTKDKEKRIALHMSLCAGIVGVAGIFVYFDMGAFVWDVALIAAIVLLINLVLRGAGSLICRTYKVKDWLKRICAVMLVMNTDTKNHGRLSLPCRCCWALSLPGRLLARFIGCSVSPRVL